MIHLDKVIKKVKGGTCHSLFYNTIFSEKIWRRIAVKGPRIQGVKCLFLETKSFKLISEQFIQLFYTNGFA